MRLPQIGGAGIETGFQLFAGDTLDRHEVLLSSAARRTVNRGAGRACHRDQ